MPTVTVDGIDLHYEERGVGTPVLGIHGTPSSTVLWSAAAEVLGTRARAIVYDRRGFGRSHRPEPFLTSDLDEQVADAAGLLRALDAVPAVVIGRSTGGLVAIELARQHPTVVAALVLLEPALLSAHPDAQAAADRLRAALLDVARNDPARASEVVIRDALGDDVWEALPEDVRAVLADGAPAVLAEVRGTGLDLSARPLTLGAEELAAIGAPTLVVRGEDSPAWLHRVCERLVEALPAAEEAVVPGGHLIDPASPVVLAFLARFTDAAAAT